MAVEEVDHLGSEEVRVLVEAPLSIRHPAIAPPRYGAEGLPAELLEPAAVDAAVGALRAAVHQLDAKSSRDAAAAAWHAESVVRFFCATDGGDITVVRVNDDSFVVVTAEASGDQLVEVTMAVGPDGTCACRVDTAREQLASAALDTRSFEQILKSRMAEVGVKTRHRDAGG